MGHVGLLGLTAALIATPSLAAAQGINVGTGSTFSLGSGSIDLGCADLDEGGTFNTQAGVIYAARDVVIAPGALLDGGSGAIHWTRNWSNAGSFTAGTSHVKRVDGCSVSSATMTGSTTFYDFSLTTSTGKSLAVEAGSTQTISSALTLAGALGMGNALVLRSTLVGVEAHFDAQGSVSIASVDIDDIHADANPIQVIGDSLLGLNTEGWSYLGLDVPSLSWLAALLLVLSLIGSTRGRLAR